MQVESMLTSAGLKAPCGGLGVKCELGVGVEPPDKHLLTALLEKLYIYLQKAPPGAKELAVRLEKGIFFSRKNIVLDIGCIRDAPMPLCFLLLFILTVRILSFQYSLTPSTQYSHYR